MVLFVAGCVSLQEQENKVYSASYVGDAETYELKEVVASVRLNDKNEFMNMHIVFSAIINPKEDFIAPSTYSDLRNIVNRLQSRIQSQVLAELLSMEPAVSLNLQKSKEIFTTKAQAVFDNEFKKWSKSSYFEVKIVVSSLYLTDLSVGKESSPRRWGW